MTVARATSRSMQAPTKMACPARWIETEGFPLIRARRCGRPVLEGGGELDPPPRGSRLPAGRRGPWRPSTRGDRGNRSCAFYKFLQFECMATRISSTELARRLGDVLGRVRYRDDASIIERNGRPIARLEPLIGGVCCAREALAVWTAVGGEPA